MTANKHTETDLVLIVSLVYLYLYIFVNYSLCHSTMRYMAGWTKEDMFWDKSVTDLLPQVNHWQIFVDLVYFYLFWCWNFKLWSSHLSYPWNNNNCRFESTFHSTTQIPFFSPKHSSHELYQSVPWFPKSCFGTPGSGWWNRKVTQGEEILATDSSNSRSFILNLSLLCKQAYCTAEVIFPPVFTAHSSLLSKY